MKYKIKSAFQKFATTAITLSGVMTAAGITLSAQSAQALNFSLAPSSFTIVGTGNNSASPLIPINTQLPSNGFGNVFNSTFLLLGAAPGDANIPGDSNPDNNVTAESSPFLITAADISQPITLNFQWAFNGNSTGNQDDADVDNFSIRLLGPQNRNLFLRQAPNYGSGLAQTVTLAANNLTTAGLYRILITLNENSATGTSTAAGFNNINISTPVPFGFSTNTSLLVFGGVFYGMNKLRKNMAVKKSQA